MDERCPLVQNILVDGLTPIYLNIGLICTLVVFHINARVYSVLVWITIVSLWINTLQ